MIGKKKKEVEANAKKEAANLKKRIETQNSEIKKAQGEGNCLYHQKRQFFRFRLLSIGSGGGGSAPETAFRALPHFVGNPYVWGGTSLTNGADCSVPCRYFPISYSLPLGRSGFRRKVRARCRMPQPSDIICYPGRVAIYLGGGRIVHAGTAKRRDQIRQCDLPYHQQSRDTTKTPSVRKREEKALMSREPFLLFSKSGCSAVGAKSVSGFFAAVSGSHREYEAVGGCFGSSEPDGVVCRKISWMYVVSARGTASSAGGHPVR